MAFVAIPPKLSVKVTVAHIYLLWSLISTVQIEETQCAVPIAVKDFGIVMETKKPPRWILPMVPEVNPLIFATRKHQVPAEQDLYEKPASENTPNLADALQAIYINQHPKWYQKSTKDDSSYENTLNRQHNRFQNAYKAVKGLDSDNDDLNLQFQDKNQDSDKESNSEEPQKHINNRYHQKAIKKYHFRDKQYPNVLDILQKTYRTSEKNLYSKNKHDPIHNSLPQLLLNRNLLGHLRQFVNDVQDSTMLSDDTETALDDIDSANNYKSEQDIHIVPDIENLGYNKNEYSRETLNDITIEQQDLNPDKYRRYRRQVPFPPPEKEERIPNMVDNDPYYSSETKNWPWPKDNALDPADPRHQDSPYYGWKNATYVPGRFYNDDYQPFLGPDENPYKPFNLLHGTTIFLAQAIPLLKSMILGRGIEQGPDTEPYRVHWQDLKYYDANHTIPPPPDGPRRTNTKYLQHKKITQKPKGPKMLESPKIKMKSSIKLSNRRSALAFYNNETNSQTNMQNEIDTDKKGVYSIPKCYPSSKTESDLTRCLVKQYFDSKKLDGKKHDIKRLDWWPGKKKTISPDKENLFKFDKNKNYTIILKVY